MSGNKKNVRFAQLNESNHIEWIICMEVQLIRLGLWDTVGFELDSGLSEDEVVKTREGWMKKHTMKKMAEARAEIILRVEDSQLSHMWSQGPMEIWMALARVYIAQGFAMRLALR